MSKRPEYVKCVLTGYAMYATNGQRSDHHEEAKHTWCGKHMGEGTWFFMDPAHAILNARNGGRLLICPECSAAMAKTLAEGTWDSGEGGNADGA